MQEDAPNKVIFNESRQRLLDELDGEIGSNTDYISLDNYRAVFSRLSLEGRRKIFDLGAGFIPFSPQASEYTQALPEKGATLVPIDIQDLQIRSWNLANFPRNASDATVFRPVRADILKLPFQDSSFDAGVCINVVNSTRVHKAIPVMLMEARRILKPGGFIILSSFGYYKFINKDGSVFYNNKFDNTNILEAATVENIAHLIGYSSVEHIPLDPKTIQAEEERVREHEKEKYPNLVKVEVVEPLALLLTK